MYKILLVLLISMVPSQFATADILERANGAWGINPETVNEEHNLQEWEDFRGCQKSPVIISVDREKMRYKAMHTGEENFEAHADIIAIEDLWISIRYDNETEKMENGELNIWHLFFVSKDEFYWIRGPGVREGEREGVVSISRIRCKQRVA